MSKSNLAARLKQFVGRYAVIARETGVAYTTVRKVACGALKNPGPEIAKPLADWMKGRRP